MEAFVPNEIVKSKLGTKFLILKCTGAYSNNDTLELSYDAFNLCTKTKSLLHISSKLSGSFSVIPRDELPDNEKDFTIADALKVLDASYG